MFLKSLGKYASSVFGNGLKLANFTSYSSSGSNKMTFGDLNQFGVALLKGAVAFLILYRHRMTERKLVR